MHDEDGEKDDDDNDDEDEDDDNDDDDQDDQDDDECRPRLEAALLLHRPSCSPPLALEVSPKISHWQ